MTVNGVINTTTRRYSAQDNVKIEKACLELFLPKYKSELAKTEVLLYQKSEDIIKKHFFQTKMYFTTIFLAATFVFASALQRDSLEHEEM